MTQRNDQQKIDNDRKCVFKLLSDNNQHPKIQILRVCKPSFKNEGKRVFNTKKAQENVLLTAPS